MSLAKLFVVTGWAFADDSARRLTEQLNDSFQIEIFSPSSLAEADGFFSYTQALIDRVSLSEETCYALGWSMGGIILLESMIAKPDLASKIALVSTSPRFVQGKFAPFGMEETRLRAMIRDVKRDKRAALSRFYQQVALPHVLARDDLENFLSQGLGIPESVLVDGLSYLFSVDLMADIQSVSVPILLLHGMCDEVISVEASSVMHRALPSSDLLLFPQVGHDVWVAKPKEVAAHIKEFFLLSDNRSQGRSQG